MRMIKFVGIVIITDLAVVLIYTLKQRSFIDYPQTQRLETALAGVDRTGSSVWRNAGGNWLGWPTARPARAGHARKCRAGPRPTPL